MATFATKINLAHMNGKQLRAIARNVRVNPVTIDRNNVNQNDKARRAALVAAIKAK